MRQWRLHGRLVGQVGVLTALFALSGCSAGPPSVSSTSSTATVHGTVKYKGEPISGGTVRFDPTNVQRRDAKIVNGPIGTDGTYKVTTLQGANMIRYELPPELLAKDGSLATAEKAYDVPSGDSTLDLELAP